MKKELTQKEILEIQLKTDEEAIKEFYKIYNDETQNIVKDLKLLDFITKQIDKATKQERERIIKILEEEKQNLIFNIDISDRKIRNPNESKNHIEYNLLEKLKGKLNQ